MASQREIENREYGAGPEKEALLVYLKAAVIQQDTRYVMELCGYWPAENPTIKGEDEFDGRIPPMEEQELHELMKLPGVSKWFCDHLSGTRGKKSPNFWKLVTIENKIKEAERA